MFSYQLEFECLSSQLTRIPQEMLEQIFLKELKLVIHSQLEMLNPMGLVTIVETTL